MKLTELYFKIAYFLGFKAHVYKHIGSIIVPDQEKSWAMNVYNEAWEYQKTLIARGWFECPHCQWATKQKDEHILEGSGYCYEQSLEPFNLDAELEAFHHQMFLDRLGEDPMTEQ